MLTWILPKNFSYLITLYFLIPYWTSVASFTIPAAEQATVTISQGLLTLSECQHVIMTESSELLARTGLVEILNSGQLPFELYTDFKQLPPGNPQNHARRYRSHCLARSFLFLTAIGSYDIALPIRTITGDFSWDKEKDVVLIFQPFSFFLPLPENQKYLRFCELPLNFLVILYDRQSLLITSQRAIKQCCEGGKLVCFFELNMLGERNISFEDISATLKQLRSNFNGCEVTYDGPISVASWEQINVLRKQPLHVFHQQYRISISQLLYILHEKLNVTFDAHSQTYSDEESYLTSCSKAFIMDRFRSLTRATPGASLNMHLAGFHWYQAFYTEDYRDTEAPYRLQSTLYQFETNVWLLLLLCIFLWTFLSVFMIGRKADVTAVFLTVVSPFTTHLFPCPSVEKLRPWFTLWVCCSIVLIAAYGNTVTSLTAVPTAKTGTKSVHDLMEQNYTTVLAHWRHALWSAGTKTGLVLPGAKFYDLEVKLLEYLKRFRDDRPPSVREFYDNSHNFDIAENRYLPVYGIGVSNFVNKNVYICKDQLFLSVNWWSTHHMPNSDVTTWQFHLMRAAGFVDYWKRVQLEAILDDAQKAVKRLADEEGVEWDDLTPGTLAESLTHESFILLIYGLALNVVIFLLEIFSTFIQVTVSSMLQSSCHSVARLN